MKRTLFPILLGLALLGGLLAGPALTEEGDETAPPPAAPDGMPDEAEMMRLWQEYATPGAHHAELAFFLGAWTVESRMVMPGAPEQVSAGSARFEWLFDGRWLAQRYQGSVMGIPYEGFGLMGWDNYKKKWRMSWVDTMSTSMLVAEGVVCDPTGQTTALYGQMDEWMTGEHDKAVKYVTTRLSEDSFRFEIWDMAIGPEGAAVMQMTYTRHEK